LGNAVMDSGPSRALPLFTIYIRSIMTQEMQDETSTIELLLIQIGINGTFFIIK